MRGIDVSYHNGHIDWDMVKNDNVKFVIVRGGYGQNNIDKKAHFNLSRCNAVGLPVGMYWFSYALTPNMARNEARHALALAKQYDLQMPIYFDMEYDSFNYMAKKGVQINKKLFNDCCKAFCEEIENAGYYAGIYVNRDILYRYLDKSTSDKYDIWYARYGDKCDRKTNLWQQSDTGKVAGIQGNVDINFAYVDFPAIIKRKGLNQR